MITKRTVRCGFLVLDRKVSDRAFACGAFYTDDPEGHEAHRAVFGHNPKPAAKAKEPAR